MLNTLDWINIFKRIADAVEKSQDRLNALDGAIGDGDHGVSMTIGFRAILKALEKYTDNEGLDQLFKDVGRVFLSTVGGSIGPLIGTMFIDAGKKLAECKAFGIDEFREMLIAMERAVVRRGQAEPGDKTILDALHPVVETVKNWQGSSLSEMSQAAANAAEKGANETVGMISKRGRSSRLGERTLGHPDAGATSMALILRTLSDAVEALEKSK